MSYNSRNVRVHLVLSIPIMLFISLHQMLRKDADGTWTDEEALGVLIMSEHVKFDRRQ